VFPRVNGRRINRTLSELARAKNVDRSSDNHDPAAGTRRRLPATQRRAQILDVAGVLFAAEGIDQTSMRNIAGRAGVSPAVLYRHFADKDALLFALTEAFFDRMIAAFETALSGKSDPVDRLRAMMRTYTGFGIDNPHAYRLTFMTALPRLQRGAEMQAFRELNRAGAAFDTGEVPRGIVCFGMLERCVVDAVKAGRTAETDATALTEAVWASGHGLVSLVITHDSFRFTPRDKLFDVSIELMLKGLLRR
jgi:AcrR family transcriptional regulator